MDIKKLYIKSKKTVLNWGLGFAALFFILSFTGLIIKKSAPKDFNTWFSIIAYTLIFSTMLINRIKIKNKFAFASFAIYLAFSLYSTVYMFFKFKETRAALSLATPSASFLAVVTYAIAISTMLCLNILYYQVYKSTCKIDLLKNSEPSYL